MRTVAEIEAEIAAEAQRDGFTLNPDGEIREGIIDGIAANEEALGYWRCPCRISNGDRAQDIDIICPCQYRDADLAEYGRCYCALYVNQQYIDRGSPGEPIPERRPVSKLQSKPLPDENGMTEENAKGVVKVWRCQVCGYLCARADAPPICPICRAKKDRFEEFLIPRT